MEFMQLGYDPRSGIPITDSFCFGKKTTATNLHGVPIYRFRDHRQSNGNRGGWIIARANVTNFKLIIVF